MAGATEGFLLITMDVRTIDIADPGWAAVLGKARHDIFHLSSYLHVEDRFRETVTRLLVVEEAGLVMLAPLVLTALRGGFWDASSPYRHAGPVFSAAADAAWRRRAVIAGLAHLRDRGVVSLFLRSHPQSGLQEFAQVGTVIDHGPHFLMSLDRPLEEIVAGMRQNHRRSMRSAARDGHVAVHDADWTHLEEFHGIYSATMDRLEATSDYRFDREYFEGLRDEVGEHASLWVLEMGGVVAGAHVVTEVDGTVQYLLGATHPDFRGRVPQVAIFDAVLRWAHERGNREYVLGGGVQESLLHFKAGFTKEAAREATARIVVDPVEYAAQCARWSARTGVPPGGVEGFFPAYRAALPVVA